MTALPPLASLDEFASILLRPLDDNDKERAEALLDDASNVIRSEAGSLSWVDDDDTTITAPPVVVTLCKNVAKRAFLNPAGYTSETIGDWTGRFPDRDQVSSGVYLTATEVKIVRRAAGLTGLGTLSLSRYPDVCSDTTYVDVTPDGKPLPVDYP